MQRNTIRAKPGPGPRRISQDHGVTVEADRLEDGLKHRDAFQLFHYFPYDKTLGVLIYSWQTKALFFSPAAAV